MFRLNRIKNYLILLLLLVSFSFSTNVEALVKPTSQFYVNDYANILSSETEEYIVKKSAELANADGTQIVVVTVPNLEGRSLEEYANALFREFEIGDKEKNNGLLLLLTLEERQLRVEVGYGLGGILPDGKAGRFRDEYIIPYLKENKWDEGIKNGYDAFFTEIVKQNNLDLSYNEATEVKNSGNDESAILVFMFLGFFLGFAIGSILKSFVKNKTNLLKSLVFIVYFILIFILFSKFLDNAMLFMLTFMNPLGFIFGYFDLSLKIGSGSSGGGWSSGGSWSSGGGGFSGGGGSSGGGGYSGGGGSSGGGGCSGSF